MAAKKQKVLEQDLNSDANIMDIISNGNNGRVFSRNSLVDYSYKTGIWIMDYAYGYEVNVYNEAEEFLKKRYVLGIQSGTMNVITGRTQSWKTTTLIKIISNIAFANGGNVIHYDAENRQTLQRVQTLSKLPLHWFEGDHPLYSFRQESIGFDTLQEDISNIYKQKMRNKHLLEKDTGEVDSRNRSIKLMPPTVIMLDSLQNVIEKEYNIEDTKSIDGIEDLRSKTQGARNAYTIRGFLTEILPMLKAANILLFVIAHKTANMSLNPFGGVKKQFQYGKNDERISGGAAVEYNASTVSDFTGKVSKDDRFFIDQDGFDGNLVLFEPTKASTNESGNKDTGRGFDLVIDKRNEGVDNIRSSVLLLKDKGRLKGNKAAFTLLDVDGNPVGKSFRWKTILQDLKEDEETMKLFMQITHEEMKKLIAPAPSDTHGTINVIDLESFAS